MRIVVRMVEQYNIGRQLLELSLSYTTPILTVMLIVEHNMQKAGTVNRTCQAGKCDECLRITPKTRRRQRQPASASSAAQWKSHIAGLISGSQFERRSTLDSPKDRASMS